MGLISAGDLLARLGDPALRICDVRWWLTDPGKGRRDYNAAHLPGAVFVDVDRDLVAADGPGRHPLPSPADFVARMERLGIGDNSVVVAYDDAGGTIAARLWWMLDDLGHHDVRVLDGGVGSWLAVGGPLTATVPVCVPGHLSLRPAWSRVIDRDGLVSRLLAGDVTLVDVRAPERYRGEIEPVDPVPGHIPGARSHPSANSLAPDGHFLAPDVLRDRLGGLDPDVVTSCGSGVTACHTALAMRIAGLPDPILYPGSYSDWSRAGMPVATGNEPGRYESSRPGSRAATTPRRAPAGQAALEPPAPG